MKNFNFKYNAILALTLSLLLVMPQAGWSAATFGQSSDIFNIGAGARSMAMGSAFTGLSDDASAPYFNPAGLAHMDEHQLLAMHAPLFLNSDFNYVSSAHPFGDKWGSLAVSDAMLTSDGFEVRDSFNNVTDSDGDLRHNAIFASYARKLRWNIATGVNLKFIQQKVVGFSDDDLGIDLGFLYSPSRYLQAGLTLANMNSPEVKLDKNADVFRPITRFGLASHVFKDRLTLTTDITKLNKQSSLFAAGFEYTPAKLFQIRGGYNANRSYTFGIGVNFKPFRLDYAFSDSDVGAFNKFSITWAWHNIYRTDLEPPMKEGRAVYPLKGFNNTVAFRTNVPRHMVSKWNLDITNRQGDVVRSLKGDLRPPDIINWDARNEIGEPVVNGKYFFNFYVEYKNGKSWRIMDNVDLDLPDHTMDEVIDMNLQLNGTDTMENEETRLITKEERIPLVIEESQEESDDLKPEASDFEKPQQATEEENPVTEEEKQ